MIGECVLEWLSRACGAPLLTARLEANDIFSVLCFPSERWVLTQRGGARECEWGGGVYLAQDQSVLAVECGNRLLGVLLPGAQHSAFGSQEARG